MKTKAVAVSTIGVLIFSLGLLTPAAPARADDDSYAAQVKAYPLFAERIEWIGPSEPAESESAELLRAMQAFGTGGPAAIEHFVAGHPQSAWTPSLRVGLAGYYGRQGRFTLALAHYDAAWTVAKTCTTPAGRRLAVRIAAGYTTVLANLGQKDKLADFFNELGQSKTPLGEYSTPVNAARAQFLAMKSRPGDAYKCGMVALNDLAAALHIDSPLKRYLSKTASPDGGFTVAQLLILARTNDIPVEAVRRPAGAELVVPCIMHWKFNHYALVTAAEGGRYQVTDPVSGSSIYMTASAIDTESSGVFLVPANKAPAAWQKLSPAECAGIRGGCSGVLPDDTDDDPPDCCFTDEGCPPNDPPGANDGASGDGSNNDGCGMAIWKVSEPYINLWLRDIPLRYRLSSGDWMPLQLSYKQRNVAKKDFICSFGPNWECNWIGMLEVSGGNYINHLAGGGVTTFVVGTPDYKSGRILSIENNVPIISTSTGSTNYYEYSYTFADGTQYFLTRQVDRYGHAVQYNYTAANNIVTLTSVTDKDGRTITLAYNDAAHPNFITSVSDPYNRTCYFMYDDQADNDSGLLTNIVDTIGMHSSFQYDGNNLITNLTTPYGQTCFQSAEMEMDPHWARMLLVTEANGDHQLYAFWAGHSCTDYPIGDGESLYRNSYHWNRAQYIAAGISDYLGIPPDVNNLFFQLPDTAYHMAPIKHWLHNPSNGGYVCNALGAMAGPADPLLSSQYNIVRSGAVSYGYYGQSGYAGNSSCGTMKWVTAIANADFSFTNVAIQRNCLGRPTVFTHFNSDGSSASYVNAFDASGMCLQTEYGPRWEMVRGYGYNNPAHPNLLTSVTNAVGDVISYTHDPATLKVTSITFPGGLVRTNVYYASGPSQGFLQMQADIGIRTNYFTYVNGNVSLQTNELGLVTSNMWDNLDRLISTAYPDGTTISNVYDNLDIVATQDRLNQWTYYVYNPVRQLTSVTNANGHVDEFGYCSCGSLEQITNWLNGRAITTALYYDIAGRLTNTAYADGYQTYRTYDTNDQLQTISDNGGRQVQFSYARYGLNYALSNAWMISQQQNPLLLLSQQFDEYGRVTNSVDRNAVTVNNAYDLLGRLMARQAFGNSGSQESGLETFVYNSLGLTNYFDPLGHLTTFVRDAAGRVLYETNANLEVLKFTYNPADELLSLTDGNNHNTLWNYDQYGRVTNKVDNLGNAMFGYQYDADSRLTNRLQAGVVTTGYSYDSVGNLTNVHYPGSGVVLQYQYDELNRLTNMVDAVGTTAFSWTDGDQLQGENGPWPSDAVSYTYNYRLRATLGLTQPNMAAWSQSYLFDEFFRLTNVTSSAGVFGYQYASLTAPNGAATVPDLIQRLTYPNNAYSQRGYDDLGRLTSIALTDGTGTTVYDQHVYQYDPGSEVTQQAFAAGNYLNYTYDNAGQLKTAQGYELSGLARQQEQFGYAYDAAWNLSQRTNNTLVQTFQVNPLNELSTASRPPGTAITVAGSYENGNPQVAVTVSGTGVSAGAATVYADKTWAVTGVTPADGANSYTATATDNSGEYSQNTVNAYLPANVTYQYDLRGNLTSDQWRNFAYDNENQLTAVWVANTWSNSFAYDGLLRRRIMQQFTWSNSSWVETNEVHYIYDGNLVIQERDGNNVPRVTYTRGSDLSGTFQKAGGIGGLLARTDMQLSTTAYYHNDGNGNVTCMIDNNDVLQASYSYDPYGNILAMSGPLASANTYRFSSKEWNENAGLYYYGFRFYDPNLQRWLNRDPLVDFGSVAVSSSHFKLSNDTATENPSALTPDLMLHAWTDVNGNLFGAFRNDPLNSFDPYGECGPGTVALPFILAGEGGSGPPGWVLLAGTIVAVGAGIAIAEVINSPTATYTAHAGANYARDAASGVNAPPSTIVTATGLPPGYWPGPAGAREWGRRNPDVGSKEAEDRFHDIKKGDSMSQAPHKYGVNPDTGNVCDPEGNDVGNLGD